MSEAKSRPNFRIVEYVAPTVDYELFKEDFLNSFMTIPEIKEKHNLSNSEFKEYRSRVLEDTGLSRKPTYTYRPTQLFGSANRTRRVDGEFIQEKPNGFIVVKTLCGKTKYYGRYREYETAKMVRDKLVESDWDDALGGLLKDKYGCKRGEFKPALEKAKSIYPEFKDLYLNSDMQIIDILEYFGVSQRIYKYLINMIRDEFDDVNYRRTPRR